MVEDLIRLLTHRQSGEGSMLAKWLGPEEFECCCFLPRPLEQPQFPALNSSARLMVIAWLTQFLLGPRSVEFFESVASFPSQNLPIYPLIPGALSSDEWEFVLSRLPHWPETLRDQVERAAPLAPNAPEPWNNPYIQAQAARYCDIMLVAESTDPTTGNGPDNVSLQAMYNGTGKPVLMYGEFMASGDNPYGSGGCSGDVPNNPFCPSTQAARGAEYLSRVNDYLNSPALRGSDGYQFIIGISLWAAQDFQSRNFGYISALSNAYDGVQDQIGQSVDQYGVTRGGQAGNYGDAISAMRCANLLWLGGCNPKQIAGASRISGTLR